MFAVSAVNPRSGGDDVHGRTNVANGHGCPFVSDARQLLPDDSDLNRMFLCREAQRCARATRPGRPYVAKARDGRERFKDVFVSRSTGMCESDSHIKFVNYLKVTSRN